MPPTRTQVTTQVNQVSVTKSSSPSPPIYFREANGKIKISTEGPAVVLIVLKAKYSYIAKYSKVIANVSDSR